MDRTSQKSGFVSIFDRISFHESGAYFVSYQFIFQGVFQQNLPFSSTFFFFDIYKRRPKALLLFYCIGTQPIKTRITYRFCWYCDVHKLAWNNANGDRKSFWLVANQAQAERSYFRLKHTNATQSALPPKSNLQNQLLCDEFFFPSFIEMCAQAADDYEPKRFVSIRLACWRYLHFTSFITAVHLKHYHCQRLIDLFHLFFLSRPLSISFIIIPRFVRFHSQLIHCQCLFIECNRSWLTCCPNVNLIDKSSLSFQIHSFTHSQSVFQRHEHKLQRVVDLRIYISHRILFIYLFFSIFFFLPWIFNFQKRSLRCVSVSH